MIIQEQGHLNAGFAGLTLQMRLFRGIVPRGRAFGYVVCPLHREQVSRCSM